MSNKIMAKNEHNKFIMVLIESIMNDLRIMFYQQEQFPKRIASADSIEHKNLLLKFKDKLERRIKDSQITLKKLRSELTIC